MEDQVPDEMVDAFEKIFGPDTSALVAKNVAMLLDAMEPLAPKYAAWTMKMYRAYRDAGFSEDQAFELVKAMMGSLAKGAR